MSMSQSDIILIKTIRDGLDFIRKYPYHLDFIFQDAQSIIVEKEFGQKEIDNAKKWFLNTNIPTFSTFRIDKPQYPCVTVQVLSSNESKQYARLGETYPEYNSEELDSQGIVKEPQISVGPFSPSYVQATGLITLPSGFDTSLVFPGQGLFSPTSNKIYTISAINGNNSFTIDINLVENFTGAYVVPAYQTLHVSRNIAEFSEQYEINCIVSGLPGELYWLTAIVSYILLQKRQFILEKNNIQLGTINLGPIDQSSDSNSTENFFSRTISMEGIVEVTWLETLDQHIEGISPVINIVKDSDPTLYSTLKE